MKKAATGTGLKLPETRRSSNRSKRREKARKATVSLNGSSDDPEGEDYRNAIRLDFLEGAILDQGEEVDEEYDELEDIEETGGRKRKRGNPSKRKKKSPIGAIPKRFKARSLASILVEEASRIDGGVVTKYLDAEARPLKGVARYPHMKICPVSGLEGKYRDPKSGIHYANLNALEHIRERVPPWINGTHVGSSAYNDAIKSLRNDE